jgi:hypothetical protein
MISNFSQKVQRIEHYHLINTIIPKEVATPLPSDKVHHIPVLKLKKYLKVKYLLHTKE